MSVTIACPKCGSDKVSVRRDMMSTRDCGNCFTSWLPDQDTKLEATYIGDGVYIQRVKGSFTYKLFTSNGIYSDNVIILDNEMVAAITKFASSKRG